MATVWDQMINVLVQLISWGMMVHIIFSWFLDPFHSAREFTSRIFEPMLAPIRSILPQTGMLDFSPLIFILLVQFIGYLLKSII